MDISHYNDLQVREIIQPINLPEKGATLPEGTMMQVSGWGHTDQTVPGLLSEDLRRLYVTIVSNHICDERYTDTTVSDDMMCAGSREDGRGVCAGDEGDPLVSNNTLYGVVSWGSSAEAYYPTVFANVEYSLDWIKAVMKMQ